MIELSIENHIANVTLNRPEKRNAFDAEMGQQFGQVIDQLEGNPAIRCTVLSANGPAFCAGMDLKAFLRGGSSQIIHGRYGFADFVKRKRKKPVIAAVEGPALAGGFELVLACDLVVASHDAVFGLPETSIGLIAGGGGAIKLARYLPQAIANEILLTAESFSAKQANEWGLINRLVAPGDATQIANELASKIAKNAPLAVQASLRLSQELHQAAYWQKNDQAFAEIEKSFDAAEGPSAFFEKRPANWRGE